MKTQAATLVYIHFSFFTLVSTFFLFSVFLIIDTGWVLGRIFVCVCARIQMMNENCKELMVNWLYKRMNESTLVYVYSWLLVNKGESVRS